MWDSPANDTCAVFQLSTRTKKFSSRFNDMENEDTFLSDKENLPCTMKSEDLSLYDNEVPAAQYPEGSPCSHGSTRRPLEYHDSNSQDSGYSASYNNENGKFLSYQSPSRGSFYSFESGSLCSMDDAFLEDFSDMEPLENNLPQDFNKLINDPIQHKTKNLTAESPKDTVIRPLFRRALSLQNNRTTPNSSRVRSCLFDRSFKRPEPPTETDTLAVKRSKMFDDLPAVPVCRPVLQRAFSATEESIKYAVQRSSTEPDLIGDYTKIFCLPLTRGRHQDLKSITAKTLAELIQGNYNEHVASFKVIDCRYPYEFEGGHIGGAINIYTKEQCSQLLGDYEANTGEKRNILVFHCEFSSERGPNLYRHLRKEDRLKNENDYPSLNYPEIYLLEGGYKNFFEQYSEMCVPVAYKEMLHPDHESDLRHFRQKSKTWNIDSRQRPRSLKRLAM